MKAFKTIARGLLIGASIFALAGVANADLEFNMYGASAQFNFFSNAAVDFLVNTMGCNAGPVTWQASSSDFLTVGVNCANTVPANQNINLRYSSKASFDGVDSIMGTDADSATICGNKFQRPMATLNAACNALLLLTDTTSANCEGASTGSCQTVTLGLSDVQASSFIQSSTGNLLGPAEAAGSDTIVRGPFTAVNADITKVDANGNAISFDAPLAYPFAFYVNGGVTSKRCIAASPVAADINNLCLSDVDCGGPNPTNHCGSVTAHICDAGSAKNVGLQCYSETDCGFVNNYNFCQDQTIDNISRLQAVLLFSGQIKHWSDFGTSNGASGGFYTTKPVTLCYRHAGSGTHATLDLGVMRGHGWGAALKQLENDVRTNPGVYPYIWFNDSTDNMKDCLRWANGQPTVKHPTADSMANYEAGAVSGAIGYMDADNSNEIGGGPAANFIQIKYEGMPSNRLTMRDGMLDDFFAINHMYRVVANLNASQIAMYNNQFLPYLTTASKINPNTVGGAKSLTYGSVKELRASKAVGGDLSYPVKVNPAQPQPE